MKIKLFHIVNSPGWEMWSRSSGVCLVELATILPLLLVMLFGISALGTLFSQIPSLSNLNYEATLVGINSDPYSGPTRMNERFEALEQVYSTNHSSWLTDASSSTINNYLNNHGPSPYQAGARLVSIQAEAQTTSLINALFNKLSLGYSAGLLTPETNLATGNLNNSENDPNCAGSYDCNGDCVSYSLPNICPLPILNP